MFITFVYTDFWKPPVSKASFCAWVVTFRFVHFVRLQGRGLCDKRLRPCEKVTIFGDGFISSPNLTCHIEEHKVLTACATILFITVVEISLCGFFENFWTTFYCFFGTLYHDRSSTVPGWRQKTLSERSPRWKILSWSSVLCLHLLSDLATMINAYPVQLHRGWLWGSRTMACTRAEESWPWSFTIQPAWTATSGCFVKVSLRFIPTCPAIYLPAYGANLTIPTIIKARVKDTGAKTHYQRPTCLCPT